MLANGPRTTAGENKPAVAAPAMRRSVSCLSQHSETNFAMDHSDGWMHGWSIGGEWAWVLLGGLVVALLVVAIGKRSKR